MLIFNPLLSSVALLHSLLYCNTSILIVSAAGSVGVCAKLSKEKGRNPLVWGMKGLLGGPLTVSQLQGLSSLGGQGLGGSGGQGSREGEQL